MGGGGGGGSVFILRCCVGTSVSPSLSYVPPSVCPSILSFLDNNLSKYPWIFINLGICIDIVEIWFEIAVIEWPKFVCFRQLSAHHMIVAGYYCFTFFYFRMNMISMKCQALFLERKKIRKIF